ncbi:hypothetical protein EB259_19580 [Salmonella enterica]|nr:hypothetical protein [Salmonella enterica]EBE4962799.1 hypothetical protein [Salmonella enterica]EBT5329882.1 hypothetical protein [Salmonella enterica]ECH4616226.1 hypothetical protein [Salmonella enterica]MDJ43197.1 hypothetical protein [Salmonella enterica]
MPNHPRSLTDFGRTRSQEPLTIMRMYPGLRHQEMWRVYCQAGVVRRHLFTPGFSRSDGHG